ncbi:GCN5- N-acetyltransferase [Penicillium riverlandense]|uniref:GCN5- N-acetyltransferase n=1 Tax=Penicillium riverlandense TaxID=1903569 RepID=UPI002548140C|nr:GCN5- N-acetyltransferase [Penicillium riverlandense]KAJ5825619.1 GCN5- N-acetyltransferase [Penicillium riverlandense]
MDTVTVRLAKAKDAPLLLAVERSAAQVFLQLPDLAWIANDSVQSEERHLELIERGAAWVAVTPEDIPIGFLNGKLMDQDLHIKEISVQFDYQGKGIGRKMMRAAREWAVSHGCLSITLTTFRDVPWNEGFYRSLGFTTLKSSELTTSLKNVMKEEADAGLPIERRCAMCLRLL